MKKPRMSPPRKPRGEKPATTIRFLRRQIDNLQMQASDLRHTARTTVEVNRDLLKHARESEQREKILIEELENSAEAHGRLLATTRTQGLRLAFLEGYYAKSTETLPGAGPGNPEPYQDGAADIQAAGHENAAARTRRAAGGEIQGVRSIRPTFDYGRSLDGPPIAGAAHDATPSELARHRG